MLTQVSARAGTAWVAADKWSSEDLPSGGVQCGLDVRGNPTYVCAATWLVPGLTYYEVRLTGNLVFSEDDTKGSCQVVAQGVLGSIASYWVLNATWDTTPMPRGFDWALVLGNHVSNNDTLPPNAVIAEMAAGQW